MAHSLPQTAWMSCRHDPHHQSTRLDSRTTFSQTARLWLRHPPFEELHHAQHVFSPHGPKAARNPAGLSRWWWGLQSEQTAPIKDVEAFGSYAVVNNYKDLRKVAEELSGVGMKDDEIHKICLGNQVRVLKEAMSVW